MDALPTKTYEALAAAVRAEVVAYVRTLAGAPTWCEGPLEALVVALPVRIKRQLGRKNGLFAYRRTPLAPGAAPPGLRQLNLRPDHEGAIEIAMYVRNCKSPEAFRATLLHEWAHALVHWVHGPHAERDLHGPLWVATAKALGLPDPRPYTTHDDNDYWVAFRCACPDQSENRTTYAKARRIRNGACYRCGRCKARIELAA